jgi:hypothetical protein
MPHAIHSYPGRTPSDLPVYRTHSSNALRVRRCWVLGYRFPDDPEIYILIRRRKIASVASPATTSTCDAVSGAESTTMLSIL